MRFAFHRPTEKFLFLEGTKSMKIICGVRGMEIVKPDQPLAIAPGTMPAIMSPRPSSGGAVQMLSSTMLAELLGQRFLLYGSYSSV